MNASSPVALKFCRAFWRRFSSISTVISFPPFCLAPRRSNAECPRRSDFKRPGVVVPYNQIVKYFAILVGNVPFAPLRSLVVQKFSTRASKAMDALEVWVATETMRRLKNQDSQYAPEFTVFECMRPPVEKRLTFTIYEY